MASWRDRATKVETAAPEAGSWRERATAVQPEQEEVGLLASIGRGAGSGYLKQWQDEIAGGIGRLVTPGTASEAVGRELRDANRADDAAAMRDHPVAYTLGNIGGELASDAALHFLTRGVINPANPIVGAALGALSGAGAADAETGRSVRSMAGVSDSGNDETIGKLAGAFGGGAAALATHGAGKYVVGPAIQKGGAALKHIPDAVRQFAEERAFKAAGPMLKDFRAAGGIEGAREMGRDLLDQGIVTFGRNAGEISEAAVPKVKEIGKRIGAVRQQLDESLPVDVLPTGAGVAGRIEQEVLAPLMSSPANRRFAPAVKALADEFATEGDAAVNMSKLTGWKKDLQDQINYQAQDPALPVELKKRVARILQDEENRLARIGLDEDPARKQVSRFADEMQATADASGDKRSGEIAARMRELAKTVGTDTAEYRELKRLYGNLIEPAKFSTDQELRQEANRILSPSDHGLGLAAAAGKIAQGSSAPEASLSGLALAVGNKVFRERGNSATAVAMDKLSRLPGLAWTTKISGEAAEAVGRYAPALLQAANRGPQAVAATLYVLSQKDPKVRKAREEGER